VDDWNSGKKLTGYSVRKAHESTLLWSLPALQNPSLNSGPSFQYSIAPTTPGSEDRHVAPIQGAIQNHVLPRIAAIL
jgi:hypothetical protein